MEKYSDWSFLEIQLTEIPRMVLSLLKGSEIILEFQRSGMASISILLISNTV
jgi:hypothetical protein